MRLARFFLFAFWVLIAELSIGQVKSIKGFVHDQESKEPIYGAVIQNLISNEFAFTDKHGFFYMSIKDSAWLNVSFLGYNDAIIQVHASYLEIPLKTDNTIDTVVIYAPAKRINQATVIPLSNIKWLPAMGGEPDIFKTAQLMPGIKMANEGTSTLIVRGGSPDQNLMMLDDVPVHYISHLGGFASAIDASILKSMTLYKSYFPAEYHGRLSSIVDMQLREGSQNKRETEIQIGTIMSKVSSHGPLYKDKFTYVFSARRCNIDLVTKPITFMTSSGNNVFGYTFTDVNAKINYTVNPFNKLSLMTYYDLDKLGESEKYSGFQYSGQNKFKNQWGNFIGSIRWYSSFSRSISLNSTIAYSEFQNEFKGESVFSTLSSSLTESSRIGSRISEFIWKEKFNIFTFKNHAINTGFTTNMKTFLPVFNYSSSGDNRTDISSGIKTEIFEYAFFITDRWKITDRIFLNAGVNSIVNSNIKRNAYLEPRLNLSYELNEKWELYSSYSKMHQFIHMANANSSGIPSESWRPASNVLLPQSSQGVSVGANYGPFSSIKITLEAYLKEMENLVEIESMHLNSGIPIMVDEGKGFAHGIETLITFKNKKTDAWISYCLSKADRLFDVINNGKPYPYHFDRRHDVSLVYTYKFNDLINISAVWSFASSNAYTLAVSKYRGIAYTPLDDNYEKVNFQTIHYYNGINSFRGEPYHRLDLSLNMSKEKIKGIRTWHIGVINAYNHLNPYYYYYKYDKNTVKLYKKTLFPIMPMLAWSYKFN